MRVDAYTKVMLSVIAGTLLLLTAREFQNPPTVSAQQPHVQHVIIDDLAPHFKDQGLPVSARILGPEHVIIDSVDPILSIRGIPVSVNPVNTLAQTGSWQYAADRCDMSTMNSKGLLGWELVSWWLSPGHVVTFDSRSGRGLISGKIADEADNTGMANYGACIFKKRL